MDVCSLGDRLESQSQSKSPPALNPFSWVFTNTQGCQSNTGGRRRRSERVSLKYVEPPMKWKVAVLWNEEREVGRARELKYTPKYSEQAEAAEMLQSIEALTTKAWRKGRRTKRHPFKVCWTSQRAEMTSSEYPRAKQQG